MLRLFYFCERFIWMLGSLCMVTAAGKTAINHIGDQGAGAAAFHMLALLVLTVAVVIGLRKPAKQLVDIVRLPYLHGQQIRRS